MRTCQGPRRRGHVEANQFSVRVWEAFLDWVSANHPDDAAIMFAADGTDFADTDESIASWERRTREYVEATRG